jgi:ABC-type Fe3+-hydroxamate transport system substrate-binding protein
MNNAVKRQAVPTSLLLFFCVLFLLTAAVGFGCRGPAGNVIVPAAQTKQVTDDLGRTVTVPAKVARAISLAPSITESIFAVGGGDRLIGVTTYCNYPAQAQTIAKVGDTLNPNIETIIALKPDVVFVSTASQIEAFMQTLAANGVVVYVLDAQSFDGVFKDLRQLGQLFGTSDRAERVVTDLQRRVSVVGDMVGSKQPVRVFVQFSREPLFTMGSQSYLNEALEKAGAVSVTADVETAFPKLSKETAANLQPEAIILSESEDNREPNDAFRGSPAVKDGRVYSINADLLSRPGPRLVDAIEQIAQDLRR